MALNPEALDLDLIKGTLGRRSLKGFIKAFWHIVEPATPFVDGWHIDCFCDHLANLGQIRNILINLPPGHCKSLIFAVFYPAWLWITQPSKRLLCASYSLSLSERDSVKCRRLVESALYRKCYGDSFSITTDVNTKRHFENDKTGYRQAISVGSTTTGLKANVCLLDDAHNALEADSVTKREHAITWFMDSFYNRVNDFATDCRIVIGQRIAKDDLSGYIKENFGDDWCYLTLPYEYKPTTYVSPIGWSDPRKEEGEPLWPERFPLNEVQALKRKPRTFASQWNQAPTESTDAPFKAETFRYYDATEGEYILGDRRVSKAGCFRLTAADLAVSQAKGADYTAIATADVTPFGDIILIGLQRERMPGTKLVPALQAVWETWHPAYVVIEDVAMQRVIVDQARAAGIAVRPVRPGADKEARSIPLQVRFESGQVWFPRNVSVVSELQRELLEFPCGTHDDMVDALAYLAIEAAKRLRSRPGQEMPKPKVDEEAEFQKRLWADSD